MILPRTWRQTGFARGICQEFLQAPMVFDGDLRKQHSPLPAELEQNPVPADADVACVVHLLKRREDGNFTCEVDELVCTYRREPRVFTCGFDGNFLHHLRQRERGFEVADAAAQFPVPAQRHEGTAGAGQRALCCAGCGGRTPAHRALNRVACNRQQFDPLLMRQHGIKPVSSVLKRNQNRADKQGSDGTAFLDSRSPLDYIRSRHSFTPRVHVSCR